jgi:segregation and condensation protein B
MRFGLKDVNELPSMEEFEKLVAESFQSELMPTEIAAQTESAEPDNRQPAEPEVQAEPVAEPLAEAPEQTVEETEKAG